MNVPTAFTLGHQPWSAVHEDTWSGAIVNSRLGCSSFEPPSHRERKLTILMRRALCTSRCKINKRYTDAFSERCTFPSAATTMVAFSGGIRLHHLPKSYRASVDKQGIMLRPHTVCMSLCRVTSRTSFVTILSSTADVVWMHKCIVPPRPLH